MIPGQMDIYECIAEVEREQMLVHKATAAKLAERYADLIADDLEDDLGHELAEDARDELTFELVGAIEEVLTEA